MPRFYHIVLEIDDDHDINDSIDMLDAQDNVMVTESYWEEV